jgi:hypothetical protein
MLKNTFFQDFYMGFHDKIKIIYFLIISHCFVQSLFWSFNEFKRQQYGGKIQDGHQAQIFYISVIVNVSQNKFWILKE